MVSSRVAAARTTDLSGAGVRLPQGNYEVAMRFDVPRAQLIDWRITCPGVDVEGQAGETMDQYRARRVEALQRERERDAANASTAASIVIGAVAPVRVEVHAGAIAGLPADDVGAGSVVATARVITASDGVCGLQVTADDPSVRAAFTVTRIRDLDAEQRMKTIAQREVAVKARGQLSAQLVTAGADPAVRQARGQPSADARARAEARALYARQEYLAYLAGKCNAEPEHREPTANDAVRLREARLEADAARAQRRDQTALHARASIQAQLVALGAKPRPAMPPPKPEAPGPAPFEGAEWVAGYWSWESNAGVWEWEDGGWHEPGMLWEAGAGVYNIGADEPTVRDHRRNREHTRDHREVTSVSGAIESLVGGKREASRDDKPVVRDHRGDNRGDWTPVSRDDDKKDDDDKPIVRDHRR